MRDPGTKSLPVISRFLPGHIGQSVTCLATDTCLAADQGVASSIWPGLILSWRLIMKSFLQSFSSLPLNHSRWVVVSYMRLFKLALEKVLLGELTIPPGPYLLTWDVMQQAKQTNKYLNLYLLGDGTSTS